MLETWRRSLQGNVKWSVIIGITVSDSTKYVSCAKQGIPKCINEISFSVICIMFQCAV